MKNQRLILLAALAFTCVSLTSGAAEPKKIEVGKPAPDFSVTGIDGEQFKLSDKLRDKDNNVVLLFSRAHW